MTSGVSTNYLKWEKRILDGFPSRSILVSELPLCRANENLLVGIWEQIIESHVIYM